MLIKVAVVFLVFILILGMFGKWRYPGRARLAAAKCPHCGRYNLGKSPCACGRGRP
ncbi:hypothetical protein SAMN04488003_113108 [Loktanella fryxellensis]|uniref:Uncharacterized protein n=1 Tax=Loktanella fryxellensis TaxID=245187 RepID=A0A1H8FR89_9RHOB|nr:hypothetical protein [Loktanella fryxellensis]SEN34196.1 hypothetical protein SAMN04488003_113108 [Loktanella fryxellensis]